MRESALGTQNQGPGKKKKRLAVNLLEPIEVKYKRKEQAKSTKEFNVDDAFNTAGFPEFLTEVKKEELKMDETEREAQKEAAIMKLEPMTEGRVVKVEIAGGLSDGWILTGEEQGDKILVKNKNQEVWVVKSEVIDLNPQEPTDLTFDIVYLNKELKELNKAKLSGKKIDEQRFSSLSEKIKTLRKIERLSQPINIAETHLEDLAAGELEEKFELFLQQQEAARKLKSVYKEKIQTEIGLELDEQDFLAIDKALIELGAKNPDMLKEISLEGVELSELDAKIKHNEEFLKDNLGEVDFTERMQALENWKQQMIRESFKIKDQLKKKSSVWSLSLTRSRKQKKVERLKNDLELIENEIKQTIDKLIELPEQVKATESLKKQLHTVKVGYFDREFLPQMAIAKVAQEKMLKQSLNMIYYGNYEEIDQALKTIQKVKTAKLGIDYLKDIKPGVKTTQEDLEENKLELVLRDDLAGQFDVVLDNIFFSELNEAMVEFKLGGASLQRLEKVLEKFTRKETIGFKNKEKTKELINNQFKKMIKKFSEEMPNDKDPQKVKGKHAKIILLKRILIKINS